MGLSSKEVSGDHDYEIDWSKTLLDSGTLESPKPRSTKRQQQQQQQSEQLNCPRCDSSNTKFCYYNNYNKTQPRHFCKACKRHWTKGGTLRNVPVGGGRKNKRLKRPSTAAATTTSSSTMRNNFPQGLRNQKDISHVKTCISKPIDKEWSTGPQGFSMDMQGLTDVTWDINNGTLMSSAVLQAPQNQSLGFAFSGLSSFDAVPSSIPSSFSSLNGYKGGEKLEANMEDSTITSIFPSTTTSSTIVSQSQPWQGPSTTINGFIDPPNYWNWNIDVDTMVLADLNIPWDDSEFEP